MDVKERILMIELVKKAKESPKAAKELGIKICVPTKNRRQKIWVEEKTIQT